MNSRQSWLLSCCVSEKNCRRCMYRYAWATRTLRAVAALLALHADELADSCIEPPEALSFLPNPPTGAAFLFDALAVRLGGGAHLCACQASCRRLRLGGGAHLCACQGFVSPRRRLPLASAFVCEECGVIKVRGRNAGPRGDVLQSRRRVVTVSPSGMPAGLSRYRYQVGRSACGTASGLRDIALLFTCRSAKFTCREVCFESNTNNLLQP